MGTQIITPAPAPRDSRARYCECGRRISANKRVCLECAEKACVETSLDAARTSACATAIT